MENIKKVTIEAGGKVGEIVNKFDGTWDIFVNGESCGSLHYTDDQVKKIMSEKEHTIEYK